MIKTALWLVLHALNTSMHTCLHPSSCPNITFDGKKILVSAKYWRTVVTTTCC